MKDNPRLALFLGEATGIGPEITAKAVAEYNNKNINLIVVGDEDVFKQGMEIADVDINYKVYTEIDNIDFSNKETNFYQINGIKPEDYELGTINKKSGYYTAKGLEILIKLAQKDKINGIVYAPYNKEALNAAGFHFEDEIRYFADLLDWDDLFGEVNYFDGLWATRVTSHVGIKDVSKNITKENVMKAILLANQTVKRAGIKPKIGITGLNPHNGDGGLFGREEIDIIRPVVEKAQEKGIDIEGPFSADTFFIRVFDKNEYNVVIFMYHDQGQIALKLKKFDKGVTISGGFPIALATPAHGTAFDIVGQGKADPSPLQEAIKISSKMISED